MLYLLLFPLLWLASAVSPTAQPSRKRSVVVASEPSEPPAMPAEPHSAAAALATLTPAQPPAASQPASRAERRAAERADRTAKRARWAADAAAAARLRIVTRQQGEDATGAAVLAALTDGVSDPTALALAAESGTRSARSQRGTMDRAAARDAQRALELADAGAIAARESRADTYARLLRQRYGYAFSLAVEPALASVDAQRTAERIAASAAAYASALETVSACHGPAFCDRGQCKRCDADAVRAVATLAALLADAPVAKAEHDPATCTFVACKRCERLATRPAGEAGALAVATGKGEGFASHKVNRADRQPSERYLPTPANYGKGKVSTDGQTQIITESRLPSMLATYGEIRAAKVKPRYYSEPPSLGPDSARSVAVRLLDSVTEPSAANSGYSVRTERIGFVSRAAYYALLLAAAADIAARFEGTATTHCQTGKREPFTAERANLPRHWPLAVRGSLALAVSLARVTEPPSAASRAAAIYAAQSRAESERYYALRSALAAMAPAQPQPQPPVVAWTAEPSYRTVDGGASSGYRPPVSRAAIAAEPSAATLTPRSYRAAAVALCSLALTV